MDKAAGHARLTMVNGRPAVAQDGVLAPYATYSDMAVSDPEKCRERYAEFIESGVHSYIIQPWYKVGGKYHQSAFWTDDGVYPEIDPDAFFCVDQQAKHILSLDGEAKLYFRFCDFVPWSWFDKNPEHTQRDAERNTTFRQPSLASNKGLGDVCHFIERLIGYCLSRPWSDKVCGFFYIPSGEGVPVVNIGGTLSDHSEVNQQAFREFLKIKYITIEKLSEAWGTEEFCFDSVGVPLNSEWRAAKESAFTVVEGDQLRKVRDYLVFMRGLFVRWYGTIIRRVHELKKARPFIFGIDMCKQPMLGWQHNLSFFARGPAEDYPNILSAGGGFDVSCLLDEPGLDALLTPADYTCRAVGCGWEPEGLSDSMLIRGKTIFTENDCRTFTDEAQSHTLGTMNDTREMRAFMYRNAANALTRGYNNYFATLTTGFFNHPLAQEHAVRPVRALYDAAFSIPHKETEHAIAMIIDDTTPLYDDSSSSFQNIAVLWQRVLGLSHCGIPFRVYLLDDLAREEMPDYKCYLFPNLYMMDETRLALLRKKVFRDGRLSIFGPLTGATDGTSLTPEWAGRLTGVEMELRRGSVSRRVLVSGTHEVTRSLPASTIYGDSLRVGPIIIPAKGACEKAGAVALGQAVLHFELNRPGLFIKDFGTHKTAWSAAAPLPQNLLRELARWGGCNVWCEDDDVVSADKSMVSLHSIKSGPRRLTLPEPVSAYDFIKGSLVGDNIKEINIEVDAPETFVFLLGDAVPRK
ncbi:MAG: beta-galactosidase [Defluviitaleaceae bacterium]|nr:beta-galactosidase [Defluviitaleaceae bacterium]